MYYERTPMIMQTSCGMSAESSSRFVHSCVRQTYRQACNMRFRTCFAKCMITGSLRELAGAAASQSQNKLHVLNVKKDFVARLVCIASRSRAVNIPATVVLLYEQQNMNMVILHTADVLLVVYETQYKTLKGKHCLEY